MSNRNLVCVCITFGRSSLDETRKKRWERNLYLSGVSFVFALSLSPSLVCPSREHKEQKKNTAQHSFPSNFTLGLSTLDSAPGLSGIRCTTHGQSFVFY